MENLLNDPRLRAALDDDADLINWLFDLVDDDELVEEIDLALARLAPRALGPPRGRRRWRLNGDGREPVGLHDLRHSLAAMGLEAGMSVAEVASVLRHANARVTAQVYVARRTRRGRRRRLSSPTQDSDADAGRCGRQRDHERRHRRRRSSLRNLECESRAGLARRGP